MIQEGLYATLSGDAGVSAIVGTRIYPLVIPQTVYSEATKRPCIVYSFDSKGRQIRFSGTDTLVEGRFTIDCYATTYSEAQDLAEAVRGVLVDYSGTMTSGSSPQTTNDVKKLFIESERDLMDIEPGLYRVMQEYKIWYDEA